MGSHTVGTEGIRGSHTMGKGVSHNGRIGAMGSHTMGTVGVRGLTPWVVGLRGLTQWVQWG